jgi:phosphoribosylanthranilate isomerase
VVSRLTRTRIKFCGITRAQDADFAVELGVDALGFVMVPASRRYLAPERAAKIRHRLPPFVASVALFLDADSACVQDAIDALQPDLLQFHGHEDAGFCASFGLPYIKAIPMHGETDAAKVARRFGSAAAVLLDSHASGELGGTGLAFDWKRARKLGGRFILAGGLDAKNVGTAIRAARPYAVDVSSGIEQRPGIKDPRKMKAFVKAAGAA